MNKHTKFRIANVTKCETTKDLKLFLKQPLYIVQHGLFESTLNRPHNTNLGFGDGEQQTATMEYENCSDGKYRDFRDSYR